MESFEEEQGGEPFTQNGGTVGEPLEKILVDPALREKIRSILTSETSKEESPDAEILPPDPSDFGRMPDGLASVLKNPDLMAKLPQIMELVRPIAEKSSRPGSPKNGKRSPEDDRNDLLCSLKPFLSPPRREAVDTLLRISKLGKVLKDLK